jgi:hypothetical protein
MKRTSRILGIGIFSLHQTVIKCWWSREMPESAAYICFLQQNSDTVYVSGVTTVTHLVVIRSIQNLSIYCYNRHLIVNKALHLSHPIFMNTRIALLFSSFLQLDIPLYVASGTITLL